MLRLAVLSRKYLPAAGSSPSQRAASTRRKCPLEKSNTFPCTARAFDRAVCPRPDLVRRFPSGASITKQLPLGALLVDISGEAALILAVVPFEQVPVDFSHSSKASQLAGSGSALQRAGKHLGESHSAQPFLKPARIALATLCQRQVRKSRVLARERPRGFSVSGQVNDWKHFAHRFTLLVLSRRSCPATPNTTTSSITIGRIAKPVRATFVPNAATS